MDTSSASATSTVVSIAPAPTSSSPAAAPTSPAAPQTTHAAVHTSAAPAHTSQPPKTSQPVHTTAKAQSCYPRASSGNCYKPGEFCPKADHGESGIDADGDPIVCEDNNGWRWERT